MDFLLGIYNWLVEIQPAFPWLLIFNAIGFVWMASLAKGLRQVDGDSWFFGSFIAAIAIFVLGFSGGSIIGDRYLGNGKFYVFHLQAMIVGIVYYVIYRIIFGIGKRLFNWFGRKYNAVANAWRAWRSRVAKKKEAARLAKENAPEAVIARCAAAIKEYTSLLSTEPDSAAKIREAASMLERLRRLYQVLHVFQQPVSVVADNFDQLVARTDGIFSEVSLLQERDFLRKLREECRPVELDPQAAIAATEREIEKLVLTIESLPKRAMHQLMMERSEEVNRAADDLRAVGITVPPVTARLHTESQNIPPVRKTVTQ